MKKIIVIGNIGKDAEIKEFNENKAINFTIAENEYYKDKDGNKVEKTTWFSCTYWKQSKQSTKIADYLKKGTKVYIEGTPIPDYYVKDGNNVPYIKINVKSIELLSQSKTDIQDEDNNTDDLPF